MSTPKLRSQSEKKKELIDLNNRLEVLVKEIGPLYTKHSETRQTTVVELESVIQTLQEQIENGNTVIHTLRAELDKVCVEKDDIILDSRRKDMDIDALQEQIQELEAALEEAKAKQEELTEARTKAEESADELQVQVEQLTSESSGSERQIKTLQRDLDDAQSALAQVEEERDGLQRQINALRQERDSGSRRVSTFQQDAADLQARLTTAQKERLSLQKQNDSLGGQLDDAAAQNKELQDKIDALKKDLQDARNKKEEQEKINTDLANMKQTLEEDNEYIKQELDRKNKALSSLTIQIKEITKTKEESIHRDYNVELSQALSELRDVYAVEADSYRHALRAHFDKELRDVRFALDQAKAQAEEASAARDQAEQAAQEAEAEANDLEARLRTEQERNVADRAAHNEELQRRKDVIDDLEQQLLDLQQKIKELKTKSARPSIGGRSSELERELEAHRRELAQQSILYKELLGEKLELDREIALYRKWLAEGEKVVFGSSDNSPWRKRQRAIEDGTEEEEGYVVEEVKQRRTKRSRPGDDGSFQSTSELTGIRANTRTTGRIHIDTFELTGLYVKLNNLADENVDMSSWTVTAVSPDGAEETFKFPRRYSLDAGESVTVYSASGENAHTDEGLELDWSALDAYFVAPGSAIVLKNKQGEVVSTTELILPKGEGEQIFHAEGEGEDEEGKPARRSSWLGLPAGFKWW